MKESFLSDPVDQNLLSILRIDKSDQIYTIVFQDEPRLLWLRLPRGKKSLFEGRAHRRNSWVSQPRWMFRPHGWTEGRLSNTRMC